MIWLIDRPLTAFELKARTCDEFRMWMSSSDSAPTWADDRAAACVDVNTWMSDVVSRETCSVVRAAT